MFATLLATALTASPQPLDLAGTVRDTAGRPLPNASVFIRTAAPRNGVGVL